MRDLVLRYYPDKILKRKIEHLSVFPYWLPGAMMSMMLKSNGIGLAAPQIGMEYRLFVTAWGEVFIDPEIDEFSTETAVADEGCLSLPGAIIPVRRAEWVRIGRQTYKGLQARVIQHELDHLNGILIHDRISQSPGDAPRRVDTLGCNATGTLHRGRGLRRPDPQ